jgi:hypothetical protein
MDTATTTTAAATTTTTTTTTNLTQIYLYDIFLKKNCS